MRGKKSGPLRALAPAALLLLGFVLAAAPQLQISRSQKGSLFATGSARNVWMGMHGQGNWAENWDEAETHDSLLELVRENPAAFARHWADESLRCAARLPFLAVGLQPILITHEPGPWRNWFWVAAGTLGLFILTGLDPGRLRSFRPKLPSAPSLFFLAFAAAYGAAVSMAFTNFRFLLILVPCAGLVVVGFLANFQRTHGWARHNAAVGLAVFMAGLTAWGFYVTLDRFPVRVREVEAALAADAAPPEATIVTNRQILYGFHLAQRTIQLPAEVKTVAELEEFARSQGADYLLFEEAHSRSREAENHPEIWDWAFSEPALYLRAAYPRLGLLKLDGGQP